MDLLSSLEGIAACVVLLGTILVLVSAIFLPKQQGSEVLRKVGRWFQGF